MLAADPENKCLVFSCYTKYLDLLQAHLSQEGLGFARIDGSQRMRERERQIASFHGPGVPILLMSLKCAVGLNLTRWDPTLTHRTPPLTPHGTTPHPHRPP